MSSALLVLIGASPASAAGSVVDPGDTMYAISCNAGADPNDWQLLSVTPSTGQSVVVGSGAGSSSAENIQCASQPAFNPVTGKSYYLQQVFVEGGDPGTFFAVTYLAELGLTTGVSIRVGTGFLDVEIVAIAIGLDGAAFAIGQNGYLYSLDLATGDLTEISSEIALANVFSFAVDPTTGIFWALGVNSDDERALYRVDTTPPGAKTEVALLPDSAVGSIGALQIDGAGRFWMILTRDVDPVGPGSTGGASLWSFTLSTIATPVESGDLFVNPPFFSRALLVVTGTAPALAATGTESTVVLTTAVGGALFLAVGVTLLVARRRRTN